MERQDFLDRVPDPGVQVERNSGLRLLLATFELESQLQEEEFFENQTYVSRGARRLQVLKALAGVGPVDLSQCVLRRDQAQVVAHGGWNRIRNLGSEILQHAVDDAA